MNKVSELFIRVITFDYWAIKRIIRSFFGKVKPEGILDLGCGSGVLSVLFPKNAYLGVDMDYRLIEQAKATYKGYNFLVGDVTKIRLRRKFQYIVIIGVIHHLNDSDAKKLFATIAFHLKKDGAVLIVEAIPPIFRWNILGDIIRKMDKGTFIRKLNEYRKLAGKRFAILKAHNKAAGIVDYGVLVLSKR